MSSKKADPKAASEKWLTSLPGAKPGAAAGESDPRSSTDLGRPLCSCQGCAQETLPSESGFQEISELGSGKPGQTCQPPRKAGQPATRPPERPEAPPGPRRPASCCCQVGARTELPGTGRPVQVAARAAMPQAPSGATTGRCRASPACPGPLHLLPPRAPPRPLVSAVPVWLISGSDEATKPFTRALGAVCPVAHATRPLHWEHMARFPRRWPAPLPFGARWRSCSGSGQDILRRPGFITPRAPPAWWFCLPPPGPSRPPRELPAAAVTTSTRALFYNKANPVSCHLCVMSLTRAPVV